MKAMEALKTIMEKTGYGTNALWEAMGNDKTTANRLSQRFKQENVSVKKLDEMLRVMGYKVVIMPSNEATPKNGIKIE